MLRLVFDTATKWLYVALVKDNEVIAYYQFESDHAHSANFIYTIKTLLRSNDYTVDDITDIYTGIGPGSYTGQRIALTVAKMLASFKDIKLHQVSSLYFAGSGYDNQNVSIIFDARRGNCFCGNYGLNEIEDKYRDQEEYLEQIKDFKDLKIVYEDDFKVNPLKIMEKATLVENVDLLVPNYLRISEAEYNLLHNDKKS